MNNGDERESDLLPGIGNPARRALTNAGISRLEQLTELRESDVMQLHGFGPKALRLLREALAVSGQAFADERYIQNQHVSSA